MSRRALWVDASSGAAGDMLLGALLDAGADLHAVRTAVAAVAPEPVSLGVEATRRHGLRAARATVAVADSTTHRGLSDVLALVRSGALDPAVEGFAVAVFTRLATAEARVHGTTVDQVHFHEVGALDAVADVVGCAAALGDLALLDDAEVVVGPIALGSGRVRSAHGSLPVPVPAVLALLEGSGAPVLAGPGGDGGAAVGPGRELCTPTGAALLVVLAQRWGPLPAMAVRAVGVGAGAADSPGAANVLRVVLGEVAEAGAAWRHDDLVVLEATVDDLDPRVWPDVLDAVHTAGAVDAWAAPVLMRHGRPGHVLTALVPPVALESVHRAVAAHTTSLGARSHPVARRALPRTAVAVAVDGHAVSVKLGHLDGRVVTVQPEHADARAAAAAMGVPVREVLDRAAVLARTDLASTQLTGAPPATTPPG